MCFLFFFNALFPNWDLDEIVEIVDTCIFFQRSIRLYGKSRRFCPPDAPETHPTRWPSVMAQHGTTIFFCQAPDVWSSWVFGFHFFGYPMSWLMIVYPFHWTTPWSIIKPGQITSSISLALRSTNRGWSIGGGTQRLRRAMCTSPTKNGCLMVPGCCWWGIEVTYREKCKF